MVQSWSRGSQKADRKTETWNHIWYSKAMFWNIVDIPQIWMFFWAISYYLFNWRYKSELTVWTCSSKCGYNPRRTFFYFIYYYKASMDQFLHRKFHYHFHFWGVRGDPSRILRPSVFQNHSKYFLRRKPKLSQTLHIHLWNSFRDSNNKHFLLPLSTVLRLS